MTPFEQFIFIYFISTTALAGFAVLWRNWLADHANWKQWLRNHLGNFAKIFTCGSCFTFWITLAFVLIVNPLKIFFLPAVLSYFIQWMSLGYGALFLRFSYIATQEFVGNMVHKSRCLMKNFADPNG
jgi:hypothetical protein